VNNSFGRSVFFFSNTFLISLLKRFEGVQMIHSFLLACALLFYFFFFSEPPRVLPLFFFLMCPLL